MLPFALYFLSLSHAGGGDRTQYLCECVVSFDVPRDCVEAVHLRESPVAVHDEGHVSRNGPAPQDRAGQLQVPLHPRPRPRPSPRGPPMTDRWQWTPTANLRRSRQFTKALFSQFQFTLVIRSMNAFQVYCCNCNLLYIPFNQIKLCGLHVEPAAVARCLFRVLLIFFFFSSKVTAVTSPKFTGNFPRSGHCQELNTRHCLHLNTSLQQGVCITQLHRGRLQCTC